MRNFIFLLLVVIYACPPAHAQEKKTGAKRTATNVTGRYSMRAPSAENSLDVQQLPGGKVKIYLYASWIGNAATGNVNTGEVRETLPLKNRTAVYESGQCMITISFVKDKAIVRQTERSAIDSTRPATSVGCGFGLNVSAAGTYRKRSSRPPKFDF